MTHRFSGYHGTSLNSAKQIVKSNYSLSIGDAEWLGDGVYFFVEGISSKPQEQATNWAVAQSWDKYKKESKYKDYCVFKSELEVEDDYFLDLTTEGGVEILNYVIDAYENEISKLRKKLDYADGLIINFARNEGILAIDVVKGNFYIKFVKERIKRINLRTTNCTICAVFEPRKNIISSAIIYTGEIKNETY